MSNQSNQSNQSPSNDSKLERGRKISLAQTGVTKKPVTVKVGDIEYKTPIVTGKQIGRAHV